MAGNKNSGRKGYSFEKAMQVLIDQGFKLTNEAIADDSTLDHEKKLQIAVKVCEKILGQKVDITTQGEKINQVNVKILDGS